MQEHDSLVELRRQTSRAGQTEPNGMYRAGHNTGGSCPDKAAKAAPSTLEFLLTTQLGMCGMEVREARQRLTLRDVCVLTRQRGKSWLNKQGGTGSSWKWEN